MKTLTYIKIGIGVAAAAAVIAGILWVKGLTKNDYIDSFHGSGADDGRNLLDGGRDGGN